MHVQLLLTGDELMTGDTLDSNSAMIAKELIDLGLKITKKVTVADNLTLLVNEINIMAAQADIIIINGGLGPTVDDLTALALAKAMGGVLTQNTDALIHLKAWCQRRGAVLNVPNLKQTLLPVNCQIIANETGSAVGFFVHHLGCTIYCTPGVPHELKTMLITQIKPLIANQLPTQLINEVTRLQVFGLGESCLQKMIDKALPDWPKTIELGFRAGLPLLEVKLTLRCQEGLKLKALWLDKLTRLIGEHLLGEVKDKPLSLAEHVLMNLQDKGLTITTAESCTGGLIASMLTEVSGASKSFEAGFVTYSNKIKSQLLDVSTQTLTEHGAVSEPVVIAMAAGALEKSSADLVIAVSGIAGPRGGSEEKPVGTVWIAWGSKNNLQSQCLLIALPRGSFQHYVANVCLDLIRRQLQDLNQTPHYIIQKGKLINPITQKINT